MDLFKNPHWGERRQRMSCTERMCAWAVIAMFVAVFYLVDEVRYLRLCVEGMATTEATVLE